MNPVIIDQAGPLPISTTVQWPSSNTVVMAFSGSASVQTPKTMMRVNATIKDATVATLTHFANPASTHLAFATAFHAVNGEFGQFTLTLTAAAGTITDSNDHFTVTLLY